MAALAAAWVAWAVWTCNTATAGDIADEGCEVLFTVEKSGLFSPLFFAVRPAGRTHSEVKVLYTADMGKC
jgi:hypothetical protein